MWKTYFLLEISWRKTIVTPQVKGVKGKKGFFFAESTVLYIKNKHKYSKVTKTLLYVLIELNITETEADMNKTFRPKNTYLSVHS